MKGWSRWCPQTDPLCWQVHCWLSAGAWQSGVMDNNHWPCQCIMEDSVDIWHQEVHHTIFSQLLQQEQTVIHGECEYNSQDDLVVSQAVRGHSHKGEDSNERQEHEWALTGKCASEAAGEEVWWGGRWCDRVLATILLQRLPQLQLMLISNVY